MLLLVGFEDTPDRTWILLHADLPKFCLICAPASCLKGANKQKTPPKGVCEVKSELWPRRTECKDYEGEGEQWQLRGKEEELSGIDQ